MNKLPASAEELNLERRKIGGTDKDSAQIFDNQDYGITVVRIWNRKGDLFIEQWWHDNYDSPFKTYGELRDAYNGEFKYDWKEVEDQE